MTETTLYLALAITSVLLIFVQTEWSFRMLYVGIAIANSSLAWKGLYALYNAG